MAVDIFIKSFNRVYYLDRAIYSVKQNLTGDYKIIVLDDGTPKKYLDKIKEKYPEIEIKTSKNYKNKIMSIEENIISGKDIDGFSIPTDLWYNAVKNGSEYCIVTEDDVWFGSHINIDETVARCKELKINLLKLGWLGNVEDDKYFDISEISKDIENIVPKKMFLGSKALMDLFFYNKYKFFTIGYKLGFFDNYTKRKYWGLNSILMGLWKREYWLEVWKDAKGKVDEKQQLRNAAAYYNKNKRNANFAARLKNEAMRTTFQSSATNSYHKYGYLFDVNYCNHLLNEAWYDGKFDITQNFPKDFEIEYLESFFDEKIDVKEFRKWVSHFKEQYRNLGCDVE